MDLLCKRYASPFLMINQMISAGCFYDFVTGLPENDAEDKVWEYFLHKVDGSMSYKDFKRELGAQSQDEITLDKIETTILDSFDMLRDFVPG